MKSMSEYSNTINTILTLLPFNKAHSKFKELTCQERFDLINSHVVIFHHKLLDGMIDHLRESDSHFVSL